MATEDDGNDLRFTALYDGVVVKRDDPLKIGRVKVRIPGLVDTESDWALPSGSPGGGEDARGFYFVPEVGAEVTCFFVQGDPDRPRYFTGHWGAPGGVGQAPTPVRAATAAEAPEIQCIETERYLIVLDNRLGRQALEIRDKVSGDGLAFDSVTRTCELRSTVALTLKATGVVKIEGVAVSINGRPVLPSGPPI